MSSLSRRLTRLETSLAPKSHLLYARYQTDPVRYAYDILGVRHLTPDQIAVLTALIPSHCRVLVPSGNETGKSFIAAAASKWHYDCFRPSLTLITAPSAAQVTDIVFRELRMLARNDPGFAPKANILTDGPDHLCKGFTAKEATSFHGRHDASVMLTFDEAEGVDQQFWDAGESFAHRWVCFYNPTKANSAAALAERSGLWKIVRMNAMNHPNIAAGERGLPPPIPNAVTHHRLVSRLEKWATVIRDGDPTDPDDIILGGVRYRPGPVAQARVLGQRPTRPINAVYSEDLLERVKVAKELSPTAGLQIGCDVARYGDDFSVIHVRKGCCSVRHEAHNGWNTRQVAARLREICTELAREYKVIPTEIPVVIDDTGVGGGVVDQSAGCMFIGVNASIKSDAPDEYPNNRSQIAFDFEGMLRENVVDMTRIDPARIHDIIEQLRAMSYTLDTRGRRVVAPKKDIKEALGRSPDDADGVLLAYYQFPPTMEIHR